MIIREEGHRPSWEAAEISISINQPYEIACQRLCNVMSEVAERMKLYLVHELPKGGGRLECRHSFAN